MMYSGTNLAYKGAADYIDLDQDQRGSAECEPEQDLRAAGKTALFRQKAAGWSLALAGAVLPFLLAGDATCSLVLIPAGLSLILTKDIVS